MTSDKPHKRSPASENMFRLIMDGHFAEPSPVLDAELSTLEKQSRLGHRTRSEIEADLAWRRRPMREEILH